MDTETEITKFLLDIEPEKEENDFSKIAERLHRFKNVIGSLDEEMDQKRQTISKLRKALRKYYKSLTEYIDNQYLLAEAFTKLNGLYKNEEIYTALVLFPEVLKDMAKQHHSTLLSLNSQLFYPIQTFLKNDYKALSDFRKSTDECYKEFKNKEDKFEKQHKKKSSESFSSKEYTEFDTIKKAVYVNACDYLNKHKEMEYKCSFGMLERSIDYMFTWQNSMRTCVQSIDGLKTVFSHWTNNEINNKKKEFENIKKNLNLVKTKIKASIHTIEKQESSFKNDQNVHGQQVQQQDQKNYGVSKSGYIYKRSEGVIKTWQKRYCVIENCSMNLLHSPNDTRAITLNLLTSQVKGTFSEKDSKKFGFNLISYNRQFMFATESEAETAAWVSVINNAKDYGMKKVLEQPLKSSRENTVDEHLETVDILKEFTQNVAGNNTCADCSAENPEWVSTNLGVVVCIECSGIHREMGVHVSRIRSLAIDHLRIWELFLPSSLGNYVMNEIFDPSPDAHPLINKNSSMEERFAFIREKYSQRKYVVGSSLATLSNMSFETLLSYDITSIAFLSIVGFDFACDKVKNDKNTFLHVLVQKTDETNLCVLELIVQNHSALIDMQNDDGNTPLHIALTEKKYNCGNILIRVGTDINIANKAGVKCSDILFSSQEQEICVLRDSIINKRTNKLEIDSTILLKQHELIGHRSSRSIIGSTSSQKAPSYGTMQLPPKKDIRDFLLNMKGSPSPKRASRLQLSFDCAGGKILDSSNTCDTAKTKPPNDNDYQESTPKTDPKLSEGSILDKSTKSNAPSSIIPSTDATSTPKPSSTDNSKYTSINDISACSTEASSSTNNPSPSNNTTGESKISLSKWDRTKLFLFKNQHSSRNKDLAIDENKVEATPISVTKQPNSAKAVAVKKFDSNEKDMLCIEVGDEIHITDVSLVPQYLRGYKITNPSKVGKFPLDCVALQ